MLTVWTLGGFGDELAGSFFRVGIGILLISVPFGIVRVGSLDLHKAFAADGLVTATGVIEVRRIVEETNGTFGCILVEVYLERLAIDKGIVG